jgi:hypothetical protein
LTEIGDKGIFRTVNGKPVFVPARRPDIGEKCLLYPVNGDYVAIPLDLPVVGGKCLLEPVNGKYVAVPFSIVSPFVFINLHDFSAVAMFRGAVQSVTYGDNVGNTGGTVSTPHMEVVVPRDDYFQLTYEDGGGYMFDIYFELERIDGTTIRITGNMIGSTEWCHYIYYKGTQIGFLYYTHGVYYFSTVVGI